MKKRLENGNTVVPLWILGFRKALQCIRAALKNPQRHVVFSPQNLLAVMSNVTFNKSWKMPYRCAAHSLLEMTTRVGVSIRGQKDYLQLSISKNSKMCCPIAGSVDQMSNTWTAISLNQVCDTYAASIKSSNISPYPFLPLLLSNQGKLRSKKYY